MKKRSKITLSHHKKMTCDMGYLVPLTWYEVLPADTVRHSTQSLIRVAPLATPVLHQVHVRFHHWYVPYRLIWENWRNFITGGPDGDDESEVPYLSTSGPARSSLSDYLGVPPGSYSPDLEVSAFAHRAYNLIYNHGYRDQDLSTEQTIDLTDGLDTTTNVNLLKCCWPKDYFTTCRAEEQKGDEVVIPIAGTAPVSGIGASSATGVAGATTVFETGNTAGTSTTGWTTAGDPIAMKQDPSAAGYPAIYAELSEATGIPINDLRLSSAVQRFREARNIYGHRYEDYLKYEFGVRSQDSRLQQPEYLGGGKNVIQFSEIVSTADSGSDVVGTLRGHGLAAIRSNRFQRFIPEHGLVMTLMSVIPRPVYTNNVHRSFLRRTKEDFFQPQLQFLGEQQVTNRELQADHSNHDGVFGFQKRYDEYRGHPSSVAGEFRDGGTQTDWHYGRIFSGDVALNESFLSCTPTKRVQADTDADSLTLFAQHSIRLRRAIAYNPRPKLF